MFALRKRRGRKKQLDLFFSLYTLAKENDTWVIKGSAAGLRLKRTKRKVKATGSVFSLYTSQNDIVS